MVATVKCDTITEASNTGTANLSLSSTGNVTIGNNLTVNGTTTQTGSTTFTAQTLFPDGSVSAPAISNTGDVNTGVYFPAADNVAIATGGVAALTADSSQNVSVTNTLAMGSSFKRNRIINGNMQIWQRGTSGSSGFSADRWLAENTTSFSQQTDVPSGQGFQYSVQFANTAASYPLISQKIESVNCTDLAGQKVTISFWAKNNSGSAILYSEIYYANAADNFSSRTLVEANTVSSSPSSSWTKYTWTTTNVLPSQAANGLYITIVRNNGSVATTTVTGVQLEVGSIATPYERQIFSDQLAQCQRYYEKSFPLNTAPADAAGYYGAITSEQFSTGHNYLRFPVVQYKVVKRTQATVTFYNPNIVSATYKAASENPASTTVNATIGYRTNFSWDECFFPLLDGGIQTTNNAFEVWCSNWTAAAEL